MATIAKHLVSKKKRRFIQDGFDLDMTFITRNIVAMGFPAEGTEGIYRNNMRDVKRFFDTKYRDHYKIYNLCSERDYDPNKFYGRVVKYPFDDHNAPPFPLIGKFCEDVANYLEEDERNVAVIHCKAGKGRTGVMITSFLLHLGVFDDTNEALEFYGHARTMNGKGVTIPSQVRYVHYYGRILQQPHPYSPRMLIMQRIILRGIPDFSNGTCVPQFSIKQFNYKSSWYEGISREQTHADLDLPSPLPVCGDIKLEFIHRKSTGKEKMFHLWFNTFFIDDKFVAQQSEIDKANKDKKNKIFPVGFAVEIEFLKPEDDTTSATAEMLNTETSASEKSSRAGGGGGTEAGTLLLYDKQAPEWSDSDLTTTDEDDDDWEGLPISDVTEPNKMCNKRSATVINHLTPQVNSCVVITSTKYVGSIAVFPHRTGANNQPTVATSASAGAAGGAGGAVWMYGCYCC
eukprot:gene988-4232_t